MDVLCKHARPVSPNDHPGLVPALRSFIGEPPAPYHHHPLIIITIIIIIIIIIIFIITIIRSKSARPPLLHR
jgi:hypothetical protein